MAHPQQTAIRNRLLAKLSSEDFAALQPHLEPIRLDVGHSLVEPDRPIEFVYFFEAGMMSVTAETSDDKVEVSVAGREGMAGSSVVLGVDQIPYRCFMQIAGHGFRISSAALTEAIDRSPSLRRALLNYVQTTVIQVSETAYVNANHNVESRLARWLLICHDRIDGNEVPLTHEFMSMMLGVRRPGVTTSLHLLEGMGVIRATRGKVTIRDRKRLEDLADNAYGRAEAEYERIMNRSDTSSAKSPGG